MDDGHGPHGSEGPDALIVAGELGLAYAYGVEFLELSLGSEIERSYCSDDFNAKGFHGNAILASTALKQRLPPSAAG